MYTPIGLTFLGFEGLWLLWIDIISMLELVVSKTLGLLPSQSLDVLKSCLLKNIIVVRFDNEMNHA